MIRPHHIEKFKGFSIFFEHEDMEGSMGIPVPDALKHGIAQNEAPHFRQEDNQYFIWLGRDEIFSGPPEKK
jgi:hypothetical protein